MEETSPSKPEFKPTARITVHKDHLKGMKMGEPIAMKVKGHVKGMNQNFDSKDHYDVELDNPEVEAAEKYDGTNDDNMATMPREKLKKKIMSFGEDD